MNQKISEAANATDEIAKLAAEAKDSLDRLFGRTINGYGVFSDSSSRRDDITVLPQRRSNGPMSSP